MAAAVIPPPRIPPSRSFPKVYAPSRPLPEGEQKEAIQRRLAENVVKLERIMQATSGYVKRMNAAKDVVIADCRLLGHTSYEIDSMIRQAYLDYLDD